MLSTSNASLAPVLTAPKRQTVAIVPPSGMIEVKDGDTIYSLANLYRTTPRRLILLNAIAPPYVLEPGINLKLPAPASHRVVEGDSLYSISRRYGVEQSELARLNQLSEPYRLRAGMTIMLPKSLDYSAMELPTEQPVAKPPVSQQVAVQARPPAVPEARPVKGAPAFFWPLRGEIISRFGPTARGVHNDGLNIAASAGTPVKAAADGEVAFVGSGLKAFGNLVLIKHRDNWITAYAHLGEVTVREGERLVAGQTIGTVGISGRVDSPQLHFEIRQARNPVNPADYLAS